jgi:hypothetical protein
MDITSFVGKLLEQDDVDALREGVKVLAQAVMETQVSGQIGAAPYERSSERIAFPTGTTASDFEDRAGHESGPAPGPREATGRLALVEGCRPDEAPTASDPPWWAGPAREEPFLSRLYGRSPIRAPIQPLDVAAHRAEDDRDRPRLIRATAGVPSW